MLIRHFLVFELDWADDDLFIIYFNLRGCWGAERLIFEGLAGRMITLESDKAGGSLHGWLIRYGLFLCVKMRRGTNCLRRKVKKRIVAEEAEQPVDVGEEDEVE